MFFPTQVRAHHSGSRRMPTRWPANCSVSPGLCDSLDRAPGLRRPGLLLWRSPFDATTATVHVLPRHRLNDIDQQHRPEDAS